MSQLSKEVGDSEEKEDVRDFDVSDFKEEERREHRTRREESMTKEKEGVRKYNFLDVSTSVLTNEKSIDNRVVC